VRADRVVADDVGPAEVGLPLLEDRPEVAEHDVVGRDHPVWRVLTIGLQGVRASANDPLVPVPFHPEQVTGEVTDRVASCTLANPGPDKCTLVNLLEQLDSLGLRIQQPRYPRILIEDNVAHSPTVARARG
jgi:hypothetical protein